MISLTLNFRLCFRRTVGHVNWDEYTSESDSYKPLCTISDIILVCLRALRQGGSQEVARNSLHVETPTSL